MQLISSQLIPGIADLYEVNLRVLEEKKDAAEQAHEEYLELGRQFRAGFHSSTKAELEAKLEEMRVQLDKVHAADREAHLWALSTLKERASLLLRISEAGDFLGKEIVETDFESLGVRLGCLIN